MHTQQLALEETFAVGEYPTVTINNYAGNIHVRAGAYGSVSIKATIQPDHSDDAPQVTWHCVDRKHVIVQVSTPTSVLGKTSFVNFDVYVPTTVDLDLHTNAGSIDVYNVRGQVKLHSHAGSISAAQTTLTGNASFQTNAGAITFAGTLIAEASYRFQTNAGPVDLTLPANSAFHVDAKTDVGSLAVDFPGVSVFQQFIGKEAHGDVGAYPRAQLSLLSNVGSIALQSMG